MMDAHLCRIPCFTSISLFTIIPIHPSTWLYPRPFRSWSSNLILLSSWLVKYTIHHCLLVYVLNVSLPLSFSQWLGILSKDLSFGKAFHCHCLSRSSFKVVYLPSICSFHLYTNLAHLYTQLQAFSSFSFCCKSPPHPCTCTHTHTATYVSWNWRNQEQ